MTPDRASLDGNALAGRLVEIFGVEMTAAAATCASCGVTARVAELEVYLAGLGIVGRCRSCQAVQIVLISRGAVNCVDLSGIATLEMHGSGVEPARPRPAASSPDAHRLRTASTPPARVPCGYGRL